MNVIGIIAEYNPFHNGHLYHLKRVKELYKDCIIILVLSGNFTQRGESSIIDKWDKTSIALEHGIDLVIELPLFYAINSADYFAHGAVEILKELKVDTLVFGSESNNINNLIRIAKEKNNNKKYNKVLKEYIDIGYSYPNASGLSMKKVFNFELNTPNDILGLSYIEEICKQKANIKPISIKRTNDYHSKNINKISSATAIRGALKNNININDTIPFSTKKHLNNLSFIDDYFDLLKYKILSTNDLTMYHGIEEGLENRINKFIITSNTLEELILNIKTKRYTYNRIKRILLYVLLGITKEDASKFKNINYIRILGFNNTGKNYLNKIKKEVTLPIITNYNKYKELLALEYKSTLIYSLVFKNNLEVIKKELNKPIII